jgi:hypothetical protein
MSHSKSRLARRGGLFATDPDRRVKYVLRRFLAGGEERIGVQIVRRQRRSTPREVAPGQLTVLRRLERRRDRYAARDELRSLDELGPLDEPGTTG